MVRLEAMILAVARMPSGSQALSAAARATGLALADVARRLAGTLPRVLLVDGDRDRVARVAAALEAVGFATLACDPAAIPGDSERLLPRRVEPGPTEIVCVDRHGAAHPCPAAAVYLIQRGVRTSVLKRQVTETEHKVSLGRAVLSGGLMVTKKTEKTSVKSTETRESFVLLHRNDGEADVMLYERQLDYRPLGAEMQPSSISNLNLTAARLRTLVSHAAFDDRVARPGFVSGLPLTSADPLDLALYLVALAHRRGVADASAGEPSPRPRP